MEERIRKLEQQHSLIRRRLEALEDVVVSGVGGGATGGGGTGGGGTGGLGGGWGPVVDPAPEDIFNARVVDLLRRFRGGVVDPAPDDLLNVRLRELIGIIPGGGVVDPNPEDLGRLDRTQLQARLDELEVTRKRLDNLSGLLKEQLDQR